MNFATIHSILHRVETIENHRLFVFTGESSETRVSERREMDFATIHSIINFPVLGGLKVKEWFPFIPTRTRI